MPGHAVARAGLAKRGNRQVDQRRFARTQLLGANAKPGDHAGAKALHDDIGGVDQSQKVCVALGRLEVKRN